MKSIYLMLIICFCGTFISAQINNDLKEQERIDKYVEKIGNDTSIKRYEFKILNNKKLTTYHFWKKNNDVVYIERSWDYPVGNYNYTESESFNIQNGKRVMAFESLQYEMKNDSEDVGGWSCRFWIKNDEVINMISLGNGKTEDENWDYEKELADNFKEMINEIKKAEKNKSAKPIK